MDEEESRYTKWVLWFAWYPVQIIELAEKIEQIHGDNYDADYVVIELFTYHWKWLTTVARRRIHSWATYDSGFGPWEYRESTVVLLND